jgi:branched-chain amino acid transport system substrate-binding protein
MRMPATYPSPRRPPIAVAACIAACLAGPGCGGDDGGDAPPPDTLTVYSSLPRHGDSAREADAVAAGLRLALADAGGRAGTRRVRLVELDNADPDGATWDAATVQANAERAADDDGAVAYIGELDAGGSAVSVPVTNDAGLLQISPLDGLTSLTRVTEGSPSSGPERYYPRGERTFLRLVPNDLAQARALVGRVREERAARLVVVHDDRPGGRELSSLVVAEAGRARLPVAEIEEVRRDPGSYADLAEDVTETRPTHVVYTGVAGDAAGPLVTALRAIQPGIRVLGSDGLAALSPIVEPGDVTALDAVRPARDYGPRGRRLLRRLERERGAPVPAAALYGYEAMRLVLDAVHAGGDRPDRAAVVRAALSPRRRESAIGPYAVTATGDVTTERFAVYRRTPTGLQPVGYVEPGRP